MRGEVRGAGGRWLCCGPVARLEECLCAVVVVGGVVGEDGWKVEGP